MSTRSSTGGRRRRVILALLAVSLARSARGEPRPCLPVRERVERLRVILLRDWTRLRPADVESLWYRPLQRVPAACEDPSGACLFLGSATVLPGPSSEPSPGDCSEAFIFDAQPASAPMSLTSVSLDHSSATASDALRVAEAVARIVAPPGGSCGFLLSPWGPLERGRECAWEVAGGENVVVSTRIVRRGRAWDTELRVGRERF